MQRFSLHTFILHRAFSVSATRNILTNHKLYPKVDWERVDAGNYAVVDPVNPGVILYLSEQDYIVMVRVAITSNRTLKVLAAPGESPASSTTPNDPSQNSPTLSPWEVLLNLGSQKSQGKNGRGRFLNLWRSPLSRFFAKQKATVSTQFGATGISMIGLTRENVVEWFQSWHDIVSWWSRGSQLTTVQSKERTSFALHLLQILKYNGTNHLIARLKIMLFVVNAYLGGRRMTSTQALGFRIKLQRGLPAALPRIVRDGIRFGNRHYIHIWTSMLFSYKGILGTWQEPRLSQGSICQPHPEISTTSTFLEFKGWLQIFWREITKLGYGMPNFKVRNAFFSTHAGPNHSVTLFGAGIDAFLWERLDYFTRKLNAGEQDIMSPDNKEYQALKLIQEITGVSRNYIREWLEATDQLDLWKQIRMTAKMFALNNEVLRSVKDANDLFQVILKPGMVWSDEKGIFDVQSEVSAPMFSSQYLYNFFGMNTAGIRFKTPTLQRLHNLYEAAGKVRTIAIVDYWTNFVLKPLHDWMFEVLALFPQDATFDQEGRVREFSTRGYTEVYSYDLKSATDLIPFALYRALFSWVFPEKVLELWEDLLVNRDFLVPKSTLKAWPRDPRRIRYSTGQPMGALTSWASMALVHHALVLFAAVSSGIVPREKFLTFIDYMVLGDDIVIANRVVAEKYVAIMQALKVPLSLSKSHISDLGMFNFANQTFVKNVNVSPVSLREEINASSLPERAEMALRMARRGWMDLASRTWVTPLMKKLLRADVWFRLQSDIRKRVVPPVIRWALATILTPGATRIEFAGLKSITLEIFLGAMLRKGELWGFKMALFGDLIDRHRARGLLVSILGKWVNRVYKTFLDSRKRLQEAPTWVTSVVSVDLEWLFNRIFLEARNEALARWQAKYRMPLKELQVATNLSSFSIEDIELGTGRNWSDLVTFVHQAEGELPLIPDFSQPVLEVLTGLRQEGQGTLAFKNSQARASFMRVTNVLGMIDHLEHSGTPGIVNAWDYSQSTIFESFEDRK